MQVDKPQNNLKNKLSAILSITLVLVCLVYVSNILKPWLFIPNLQFVALAMGLTLTLTYLMYPAQKGMPKKGMPWYDFMLIAISICGTGYVVFLGSLWKPALITGRASTEEIVLCLLLALAILEAARRTMGWSISIIAAASLLFVIFGTSFGLHRLTSLIYFRPGGIFGAPVTITFTIVVMFLWFGVIIQRSGAGQFIVDLALSTTGHWQGGPAKAAVVCSAGLGTITGIGPANAAITGAVTIPIMKKYGYKPEFAAAVESVASNGGTLMPPVMGVVVFIMAELLGASYWSICLAALVPAILYYICVFMQVHLEAVKYNLIGLPRDQVPSLKLTLKRGWFYLLPAFFLVYLLAVIDLPVQHAGMYTALITLIVIMVTQQGKKETRAGLKEIVSWLFAGMKEAGQQLAGPAMAISACGIILASVSASGIGFKMASTLIKVAGGNMFALLILLALVSFVLGMGVPGIVAYLVLATLVAPTIINLGIEPVAIHLFLLYWGTTALITPPVAITVFIAAGIAEADPIKSGFLAMRLGIVTFILPFIFVYNPGLLLMGSPLEIIVATLTATAGVIILAVAVEGYLFKRLRVLEICLFIVGAGLLLWPGWLTGIAGAAVIVPTLLLHIKAANRTKIVTT